MTTAKETAYNKIRNTILVGDFPPGFQLKEEELSEFCNVSRTPVRQAIQRLSDEGLVTIRENRRSYVTDLTETEFEEAFDLAVMLESYSAGLAAERISDEELEELQALEDKMEKLKDDSANNYRKFLELNMDFHNMIHRATRNKSLFDMIQRVPDVANTVLLKTGNRKSLKRALIDHRNIIQALVERDSEMAKLQMRIHIEDNRRSMRGLVSSAEKN